MLNAQATKNTGGGHTGRQKAAMLLLSLGEAARPIMSQLHEDEIRELSLAMSELGVVDSDTVNGVITEFVERLSSAKTVMGTVELTGKLLSTFMPQDKVSALLQEISGPAGRSVWEKLGNVNPQILAGYLAQEYVQTTAVVLTKLPASAAAAVLTELPEAYADACIERMLSIDTVSRPILEQIEDSLRTEFMSNLGRSTRRDNHELLAEIFNNLDRHSEKQLGDALQKHVPASIDRIRALMFVFEDLNGLDGASVQTLLRAVDRTDLCLAAKGASEAMRELLLANMSQRAAKLFADEMKAMGPVRLRDVEAAQTRIVVAAKALADRGELMLPGRNVEDELIY